MINILPILSTVIKEAFQNTSNCYTEDQSSIGDWMAYSSVPIVAGTDNIGSLFHDEKCHENFSFNIN